MTDAPMTPRQKAFLDLTTNHHFNRATYTANVDISRLFAGLDIYASADQGDFSNMTDAEILNAITPVYQRENTKWSRAMQVSFVENVVGGMNTTFYFYDIGANSRSTSGLWLIDGLQRMTAILAYMNGEFTIFDDQGGYTYAETADILASRSRRIQLAIYTFPNHYDACRHYIAMNKNITHNESDLEVAYRFLETEPKA